MNESHEPGGIRPHVKRAFRLDVRGTERARAEIEEEVRLHLEYRIEQLMAHGYSRAAAEDEAWRRFGRSRASAMQDLYRAAETREGRLVMRERLDAWWHDLRYVMRSLRRSPRYVVAVLLTMMLGIGGTVTIYSLVDRIVLRDLPYAEADRLFVVREVVGEVRNVYPSLPANASHFLEWQRDCTACNGMAAIKRAFFTLTTDGDPLRLGAARVSSNLFSLLGVQPALGRDFLPEEDQQGRHRVVLLSDAFWRQQFGADSAVIGRTITLNDAAFEVIGVLPPHQGIPGGSALGALVNLPQDVALYRPMALTEQERNAGGQHDYAVIARLESGATLEQARDQLATTQRRIAERSGPDVVLEAMVTPLQSQVVGSARRPLLVLLAAVGAVLLIMSLNLVNLAAVRSMARARDAAVRVALGAFGHRLARLALMEHLGLALVGGALGVVLARSGVHMLVGLAPPAIPRLEEVTLDIRILGVAALLSVVIGLAVGLLPARSAVRTAPVQALQSGGRTMSGSRGVARRRAAFIALQIAFSTVLLIATGLFLTSFVRVLRIDPGIDTSRVAAFDFSLPFSTYGSNEQRSQYFERLVNSVASLPGVEAAGVTNGLPFDGETWVDAIGRPEDAGTSAEPLTANFRFVSSTYFDAVGTSILHGRGFGPDDAGRLVIVLSQRTAQTFWPGDDAIGKRLRVGQFGDAEVVGIAAEARTSSLDQPGAMVVYIPERYAAPGQGVLVVRGTAVPTQAFLADVRAAIRNVDPTVPVPRMRTMSQVVSGTLASRRFQLSLLSIFAALALATASIGIYGVIAQSMATRTNELGVRMVFGAQRTDVHWLVLREAMTPVMAGLVVGSLASMALGRVVSGLLFEVSPADPRTYAGVALLLGAVATIACAVPVWRATRAELTTMLRAD